MSASKYTKEILQEAISHSTNWREVAEYLKTSIHGGNRDWIKRKADQYGLDYHWFCGKAWNKGKSGIEISYRKKPKDILIFMPEGSNRQNAKQLRRALLESGVLYKCSICNLDSWMDDEIVLEIDHIDGNYLNCQFNNLRFICPNCHSQTHNYKSKNGRLSRTGSAHS